ncbi:uncharacterized protein LOC143365825 [Halictus rubicundus]|uniref:uncharacterized protein LOC143365825 n=1 Tax=Halictus rubicundus TaxID=77578 RepID=UPI004036DFBF
MDTRILTLFVIIGVAGSLAEAHVPFYRVRRNVLQESELTAGREFVETPRAKRQSIFESSSTAESTATPKPKDSVTASAPSTTPANASPKKPNPKPNAPNPNRSTPVESPTTPSAKPATTSATESEEATTPEPKDLETSDEQKSTTPKVELGSRINTEESPETKKPPKPDTRKPAASSGHPQPTIGLYPPPISTFAPDYSSIYNPYRDPTFNSIPGPNNYAWTGTHNGQGAAASFASAGASSGGFAGGFGGGASYGAKQPPLSTRGAFVDDSPNTANANSGNVPNAGYVPGAAYIPNFGSAGGFGYSGVGNPFPDNSFVFPGYNPDAFQKQMEDYFRQLQNQFQHQQQAIFETANRIGTDGYSGQPGAHTAVSSIQLGPQGGYQAGAIHPAAPGVQSRFGEEISPPSGGSYGVFSSSSSKTVVGPDGKPVSHKISTTGVNDNGKITFRTVED